MSRIFSETGEREKPRIERGDIASFFDQRARRIDSLGPLKAVIYQDKHGDLAERRDLAEKKRVLPLLKLTGRERLLDVGCGTGRWTASVLDKCAHYHGIDISDGLVAYAEERFAEAGNCRFSVAGADDFTLEALEEEPFDRVLCVGVLMYLNDDEVSRALSNIEAASAQVSRIVFREPMAVESRLTIKNHYSEELEQEYNAIYRSAAEIEQLIRRPLFDAGFQLADSGDMYDKGSTLNNRIETRQRYMVLTR